MRARHIWLFVLPLLCCLACRRVTLHLDVLPSNTPRGAQIFVAGSFNNWNPGDPEYLMKYDESSNSYYAELPLGFGQVEYKFTRGDWTTVETDSCGGELTNRFLAYDKTTDEALSISGWNDLEPTNCGRLTLVVDSLPASTPAGSDIYLAGNISNWTTPLPQFRFIQHPDKKYYLTVPRRGERLEFKLNRGNWETVETDEYNVDADARSLVFGAKDTVHISVSNWLDRPRRNTINKTLVIDQLPAGTPANASIYLVGSFNEWNPRDRSYQFRPLRGGRYAISLLVSNEKPVTFKITRGGWETVETRRNFLAMPNRELGIKGGDTVYIHVENWADLSPRPRTAEEIRSSVEQVIATLPPPADKAPAEKPVAEVQKTVPISPADEGFDRARKVFFIVEKLPAYTEKDDHIYLAGDFNNWDAQNKYFEFRSLPNGKKFYVLRLTDDRAHEFKVTRGSWDAEEASPNMAKPANRKFPAGMNNDTFYLRIENWLDYSPTKKLIVVIDRLPANTPPGEPVYLTGDFNEWQEKDERYRFRTGADGRLLLELPRYNAKKYTAFKVTRGDWSKEFAGRRGRYLDNQAFWDKISGDTLRISIETWRDLR